MNSDDKRKLKIVAKIINTALKRSKHKIKVNWNDFRYDENNKYIRWQPKILKSDGFFITEYGGDNDKFQKYLFSLIKNRKKDNGIFYHFIKFKHVLTLLKKKELQLSSLNYYCKSDPFEYYEFIKRYSNIENLNFDYLKQRKDKYFMFCLTDSYRNQYLWDNYGGKENGVSLGIRFNNFMENEQLNNNFHFKDVYYDDGYDFEFINEIQFYLKNEMNKQLLLSGIDDFSIFYKRCRFSQEKEIRLCFDYYLYETRREWFKKNGHVLPEELKLDEKYKIFKYKYRDYIKIPLKNEFYEIQISDIICGKNISEDQFKVLTSLKNKETLIWRRK